MIWLLIVAIALAVSVTILWLLQWRRKRFYKPTKDEIRRILQSSIDETIDQHTFVQFSSLTIEHDSKLEAIRKRYKEIVNNPEYRNRIISPGLVVPLNERGKFELQNLVNELDAVAM